MDRITIIYFLSEVRERIQLNLTFHNKKDGLKVWCCYLLELRLIGSKEKVT